MARLFHVTTRGNDNANEANEAVERKISIAASNSFALGGHNSCMILEKV